MSTVTRVNFEIVSNVMHIQTRSEPLANPELANPLGPAPLLDGEWVKFDTNQKLVRAADIAAAGNAADGPSWPCIDERGRTDNQALAERKKTIISLGAWEADTRVFLVTSMAVGRLVAVSSIDIGGVVYAGLVDNGTILSPGSGITVGMVTRLPTANGGKLRIRGGVYF